MYGNSIKNRKRNLNIFPVWNVGISEKSSMFLQTAFSIDSRKFDKIAPGDTFVLNLKVCNNRSSKILANASVNLPKNWKILPKKTDINVPTGKTIIYPIEISIPFNEKPGEKILAVQINDKKVSKNMNVRLLVENAVVIYADSLTGNKDNSLLKISVKNQSYSAKNIKLELSLPDGWNLISGKTNFFNIPPKSSEDFEFNIAWNFDSTVSTSAIINAVSSEGVVVAKSEISPNEFEVQDLKNIVFDGELNDWPKNSQIPNSFLNCYEDDTDTKVFAAYSDEGIVFAFDVKNAADEVDAPKKFWAQNSIEIFVDTKNDKNGRSSYNQTDAHFWICPLVKENRAYVGRWKRFAEIPNSIFDIPGIKSHVKKSETGYILEVLLPASMLKNYSPEKGESIGINIIINAKNKGNISEIFWPRNKKANVTSKPETWGVFDLK